ncbi:MAG: hypothetical protein VZQ83_00615 [Eubacterium sp.]|nr:hypothetical protein [Eubacterium sp.]
MARYRELMEYQHYVNGEFRYVIAEDSDGISGVVGYIQYNESATPDISSTMICVRPGADGLLSFEMVDFLETETHCENHFGLGLAPDKGGLLVRARGCTMKRVSHFYRLNNLDCYHVARITDKRICEVNADEIKELRVLESPADLSDLFLEDYLKSKVPYKDISYYTHRYFDHPVFRYHLWQWNNGVMVGRIQELGEYRVLRLVDWIGDDDDIAGIGAGLDTFMREESLEYCDLYCYGLPADCMKAAGFEERSEDDVNIIPNYFEPYEQRNVELFFSLGDKNKDLIHVFKGDSDQDRPNRLML